MINFNIFPNGTRHIVTMSYDDAHKNDRRLTELFDKYGIKGTFNVNTQKTDNKIMLEEYKDIYKNHEVAVHTVNHPYLENLPKSSALSEILDNKKTIENSVGYVVRGMAYPFGTYNDEVIDIAKNCGIVYSRTTGNTDSFKFPADFMKWHPTCHHNNALKLVDRFLNSLDCSWQTNMFYIWGHSHELKTEDDWKMMEELCAKLSNHPEVWYATNIEIYDYLTAQKSLHISADESIIYNPSVIEVWFSKDDKVYSIKGGESIKI